ncbi:RagB/SusD family nutrient uptake outer membrane protein [Algoriphagus antarcticus]|uniref:SusD-like starch-binding protein associating with outer membrane n=1 Tax=Algoriphagus antarcticus TaxID=238540 RepID=A0A3E0DWF9_9BACT|nr:RagB/SusD family nutrient uptake outer membrane protein [Algoriphagus antarcticus]REG88323.1 SusD-like starch-binding protein associating with outer membrane [Algoriphagus antarcticus]
MKTYKNYKIVNPKLLIAGFLAIGGMASSCESLLDEEPKTIVSENFYQNKSDFDAATNAIYFPLRMVRSEQIAVLSAHTDWGYGRGSRAQYNDFEGFNPTNINAAAARWNSFYQGIRNANLVIQKAQLSEVLTEAEMNLYSAEAKFLRALTYFDLVRNWGGVPLRTDQNITEKDVPKSSPAEVYDLILADLANAEMYLPNNATVPGRPTLWAAKTLLADVYLQLANYEMAKTKAQEVIDSEEFQLVKVTTVDDIRAKIFGATLVTSSEEIFSFKFARQTGQGSGLPWIMNHPSTKLYNFGGAYAHYGDATNPFYKEWQDGDLRKGLWQLVKFGLGDSTMVNGKYAESQAVDNTGAGNDIPIYRYSELLLIYAEASARVDGLTEKNLEAVNQVHRRAFGLDPMLVSDLDFVMTDLTVESFLDLILQEKAYETQFEGKRWLDLKRTGRADEFVLKNKGIMIAEKHYLWPIPLEELNFNEAMSPSDQNPGY